MQAIELKAQIDQAGNLILPTQPRLRNRQVRVIILVPEADEIEEKTWLYAVQNNPAFDFLNEPEENVYTLNDGKPLVP